MYRSLAIILLFFVLLSCNPTEKGNPLFSLTDDTGVAFSNNLTYSESFNPYLFKNFYNGGGVGLGDINNDGLLDIYFSGNQVENRLYLNQGNFKFKDITQKAGVSCPDVWSSGVSMVDVNGDGWLDIYVCKSGSPDDKGIRHNELFINNGDLTFTESASNYGLNEKGLSTHAVFFDYDRDGDLDCYLLNNSLRSVGGYDLIRNQRDIRDPEGGNKLFNNRLIDIKGGDTIVNSTPQFVDVSEEAGIYGSSIGFGLGVSIGDLNGDDWPDIYVSNDFFEKDYLYINVHDGTFREVIDSAMAEISMGSMGADIGDINNDGYPEVFVTEMLPKELKRVKTKAVFESWDKYSRNLAQGYHRQFARNVLQLNDGNFQDQISFSEIGRLTGTHATDWSWGALIADFDNDGLKDIFIANGIGKDLLDQDYVNFYFSTENVKNMIKEEGQVLVKMFDAIPSTPLPNYLFMNEGNLHFINRADSAGLGMPTFSNGSAYGDLDNDGDLDLVINNVNMPSMIYRNNTDSTQSYVKLNLPGIQYNSRCIGTKVLAYIGGKTQYYEVNPMRGFQSTVDDRINIGFKKGELIDSIEIIWPDGLRQVLHSDIPEKGTLKIEYKIDRTSTKNIDINQFLLQKIDGVLDYTHQESDFSDFDREKLSYYMRSNIGPKGTVLDINDDGRDDIIIGSSKGSLTSVYLQNGDGRFTQVVNKDLDVTRDAETTSLMSIDMDSDGDSDLYMTHGGSEVPASSSALKDRIFINDKGTLKLYSDFNAPYYATATASILTDPSGALNIVTGNSQEPLRYGIPSDIIVYRISDGKITGKPEKVIEDVGLIQCSTSGDLNGDGRDEIIISGHYMPILRIDYNNGAFDTSRLAGIEHYLGMWNDVSLSDLDNDGDLDLVAANMGTNNVFQLKENCSLKLYTNDFDRNGSIEQIMCLSANGKDIPFHTRDPMVNQMPYLKKKFLKYESYAEASISDLFTSEQLASSIVLETNTMETMIFENINGNFIPRPLPLQAQFTIQYSILVIDLNGDGLKDIILGGNQYKARPEIGINAASKGMVFLNEGNMKFKYLSPSESGLYEKGEIRDIISVSISGKEHLLFLKNSDKASIYKINQYED